MKMKMKNLKNKSISSMSVLVLILSVLSINVVHAAVFDFNEVNLSKTSSSAYSSVGMTSGGIGLTVQAYTIDNNGSGTITSKALIDSSGLGVYLRNSSSHGESLGVKSVDGDGYKLDGGSSINASSDPDEGLLFVFDRTVSLDFINLDYFNLGGTGDDFNVTVDGTTFIVDYSKADDGTNSLVTSTDGQQDHFLFNHLIGKEFLIWADGSSDSFTISDLKVSAVPLPAAIWLMAPALFGIFSLSGKRKKEV